MSSIVISLAELDKLQGDLLATTFLLAEATEELLEETRKVNQLAGELAEARARGYSEASR
jgi:hypothetical protein